MTLELGRAAPVTSPFYIYVRELGKVISNCVHEVKYTLYSGEGGWCHGMEKSCRTSIRR